MLAAFIIVTLVLMILCFNSTRMTLFVVITVGFIQDPIRKLVPDEPVFFVVLVGVFFAAGMVGAILRNGARYFVPLSGLNRLLFLPLILFLLVLLIQTLATILRYDEVVLAIAGVNGYLAPLLAFPLAYFYVNGIDDIKRLLAVYIGFNIIVAASVYISFFGVDWKILQQVGKGLVIYDLGVVLTAHSGFLRSPEITAWHLAASVCMLWTISIFTNRPAHRLWFAALLVVFVGAIFLTGRRKMLLEIVVFFSLYFSLVVFTQTSGRRIFVGTTMLALGLSLWLGLQQIFPDKYEGQLDLYLQRGATVFEDAPERFSLLGLGSAQSALRRTGWMGAGMGLGSQGARFFTDKSVTARVGGSTEGGLGKLIVELGVPGVLIMFWLTWRLSKLIFAILRYCGHIDRTAAHIGVAITAFLGANVLTFIIASQVYGDLYILLLLGIMVGFVLALPRVFSCEGGYSEVKSDNKKNLYPVQ